MKTDHPVAPLTQTSPSTEQILELARREVAAREAARAEGAERPWLWAFVGLALVLLLGIFLLPIRGLDYRLQMIVHGVCAQAHYLNIGGLRMPLCARNTGIYAGTLGTFAGLLLLRRGRAAKLPPIPITLLLMLGAIAMVVDGLNSMALDLGGYNLYQPLNQLRVITGLLMGMALGSFMPLIFNISLRRDACGEQRVIGSWLEYVALLLGNAGLYLLIFWGPDLLYYPLALFSVAGIVGVLFACNLFVLAMVGGLEGRLSRLRQLGRPATFAVALTTVELVLLAGLRMWLESTVPMAM
ncbi:MAG TPA: DUF2085 domain-containing protein [Herpetosiphonaceae bacterium]|nr:DUF2085 domain-containing protein [Herpetosiphonaceae bacterium]